MSGPINPIPSPVPQTPGSKGQIVQIKTLPDALQQISRSLRVEGEVVGQNKDGTTRISTPQGDIDVTIRGKQLQPGTQVEVDIPAGNPPRNVTVRPAPAQPPAPTPTTDTPPPTTTTTVEPQQPVTTTTKPAADYPQTSPPPVQGQTPTPTPVQETAPTLPQLPALKPGDTVTLVPLPATDTAQKPVAPLSVAPIPETPQTTIPAQVQAQATQAVQRTQNTLLSTLVQAVKTVLPDSSPALQTVSTLLTGNKSAPPTQTPATQLQTPTAAQPQTLFAKIVALTLPSGETLTLPSTTAQTPTLPLQPVAAPSTPVATVATPTILTPTPAQTIPAAGIVAPPTLTVTVEQVTPQNLPVIPIQINTAGAVQNFVLQLPPATVPVGTQITLQPQLAPTAAPFATSTTPTIVAPANIVATPQTTSQISTLPPLWRAALPLMQPSSLWPAMDDVFQSFYQVTPQAAQILGRTIPSPANPGNFGPSVLLFAAALKAGDLQAWMGEKKLEMIQKIGKGDLLEKLSGDTASISGKGDAGGTDWKSFPIPLLWQNEISKVLYHVRQEPSDDKENPEMGTRFIMDLSLTRMGAVQLDGLVRGQRLDLIVRTEMPVSSLMQDAMQKAYADALDGTNIYGELGFQGDLSHMVQVLKREEGLTASA